MLDWGALSVLFVAGVAAGLGIWRMIVGPAGGLAGHVFRLAVVSLIAGTFIGYAAWVLAWTSG